jgi:hypothetical protein
MSEQKVAHGSQAKPSAAIPPLKDLLYEYCGYLVPAGFTPDFVRLHDQNWALADRDWERIVALVLDTDAVDRRATGGQAIKQAVEAAAAFLVDDEVWPWCPICKKATASERTEGTDGR